MRFSRVLSHEIPIPEESLLMLWVSVGSILREAINFG
jgi:hypothetical protein